MAVKYNTYVAVFFNNKDVRYVTGVDRNTASWEEGKPAMQFSESFAKDIVFGLTLNGYPAAVVEFMNGVENIGN